MNRIARQRGPWLVLSAALWVSVPAAGDLFEGYIPCTENDDCDKTGTGSGGSTLPTGNTAGSRTRSADPEQPQPATVPPEPPVEETPDVE